MIRTVVLRQIDARHASADALILDQADVDATIRRFAAEGSHIREAADMRAYQAEVRARGLAAERR